MVESKTDRTGIIVQAWVPPSLADEIKTRAEVERRSVSAVIRLALEDQLQSRERTGEPRG